MANVCYNYCQAFGESDALAKLKADIGEDMFINESYMSGVGFDNVLTFTFESRWVSPTEEIQKLSLKYGVLIECEFDECGCDIWGKYSYDKGQLVFTIDLPYLQGKHSSMDWYEFIECEVIGRLDGADSFEDFIEDFYFCNEQEIEELTELYYQNAN